VKLLLVKILLLFKKKYPFFLNTIGFVLIVTYIVLDARGNILLNFVLVSIILFVVLIYSVIYSNGSEATNS